MANRGLRSAMPHAGQLGRRTPWIVRAWRAADMFDRCIALGMVAGTAATVGAVFHLSSPASLAAPAVAEPHTSVVEKGNTLP